MSNGRLVYYDLQAESSAWLFNSPLAGAGHIVSAPAADRMMRCLRCMCLFVCLQNAWPKSFGRILTKFSESIAHIPETKVLCPAPRVGALSDDARLTSVAYTGISREQRPRKTKIGTQVAHVTRDSDTTFKVKRSKVNLQGRGHIVAASRTAC